MECLEKKIDLLERLILLQHKKRNMVIRAEPDMVWKKQGYYLKSTLIDKLCFGDEWTLRMWAQKEGLEPHKMGQRTYYNYQHITDIMEKQIKKMPLLRKGNILKLNGLCILDRTGDLQNDYDVLLANDIFRNGWISTLDLYLIENPITRHIKIGLATRLTDRLQQLRAASGIELNIIHSVKLEKTNPYLIEDFLHKYYKEKRRIGEWFELEQKDINNIKNLII